jgi:hypothetical protein
MIYVSMLFLALLSGEFSPPSTGPSRWYRETEPKNFFVHVDWVGCSVHFLPKSAGGGVILTNLALDRSVLIRMHDGSPAYFELEKAIVNHRVVSGDPAFAYCSGEVKRARVFTKTQRALFLGFGGVK